MDKYLDYDVISKQYEHLSYQDMHGYYSNCCRKMAHEGYVPDCIVGLSRGGLDFGMKLSHWFSVPLIPLTWQTRTDDGFRDRSTLARVLLQYDECNILICDDICDSGKTFEEIDKEIRVEIPEQYRSAHFGCKVKYAAAILNEQVDVNVDWSGRSIFRNIHTQWFVFPWEQWWTK